LSEHGEDRTIGNCDVIPEDTGCINEDIFIGEVEMEDVVEGGN